MMSQVCGPMMKEQKFFFDHLNEWLPKHEEEWVWVDGEKTSFYKTYEEAIEDAHKKGFTEGPIFIEEIVEGYQLRLFPGRIYL